MHCMLCTHAVNEFGASVQLIVIESANGIGAGLRSSSAVARDDVIECRLFGQHYSPNIRYIIMV